MVGPESGSLYDNTLVSIARGVPAKMLAYCHDEISIATRFSFNFVVSWKLHGRPRMAMRYDVMQGSSNPNIITTHLVHGFTPNLFFIALPSSQINKFSSYYTFKALRSKYSHSQKSLPIPQRQNHKLSSK